MFTRFSMRFISSILILLFLAVSPIGAIQVTYIGISSGSSTEVWEGQTHYGQVHLDEPYHTVYWYVRSPDETGLGTVVSTDSGDGTSNVSYFSYTFENSGDYEVTAYVYPESGDIDSSSYYVDVYNEEDALEDLEERIDLANNILVELQQLQEEIDSVPDPPSIITSIGNGIFYSITSLTGAIVTGAAAAATLTTGGAATPLTYAVAVSGITASSYAAAQALIEFKTAWKTWKFNNEVIICPNPICNRARKETTQAAIHGKDPYDTDIDL